MSEDIYDENAAIRFIRDHMPAAASYDDDELLNVIDMIWDFYEANGYLSIDGDDDDDEPDPDSIVAYVVRMLAKDKLATVTPADARAIVEAELAYEKSIDPLT